MCNCVQYFKPIQLSIKWSSFASLWRHFHAYACSLKRLSTLNENKINTIRGIDTISRAEKLQTEHGLSYWKFTKWTRFSISVSVAIFLHTFLERLRKCPLLSIVIFWSQSLHGYNVLLTTLFMIDCAINATHLGLFI